jgi:hypothetical protein
VTKHHKRPAAPLPWEEWGPIVVLVHTLRVLLELVFEPQVCEECEGWRDDSTDEADEADA